MGQHGARVGCKLRCASYRSGAEIPVRRKTRSRTLNRSVFRQGFDEFNTRDVDALTADMTEDDRSQRTRHPVPSPLLRLRRIGT